MMMCFTWCSMFSFIHLLSIHPENRANLLNNNNFFVCVCYMMNGSSSSSSYSHSNINYLNIFFLGQPTNKGYLFLKKYYTHTDIRCSGNNFSIVVIICGYLQWFDFEVQKFVFIRISSFIKQSDIVPDWCVFVFFLCDDEIKSSKL